MEDIQNLIKLAKQTLSHAYSPYSHFSVACVILSEKERIYTGVNVENASYGLTLCAEASAIAQMVSAGDQKIQALVVLASSNQLCPPCGSCRQMIKEFSHANTKIHMCHAEGVLKSSTIDELLPFGFDFKPNPGQNP